MARLDAELRENMRCVLNSDRRKRGKVTSIVVTRTPCSAVLSARTSTAYTLDEPPDVNVEGYRQRSGLFPVLSDDPVAHI
jgi:hypothetical protein